MDTINVAELKNDKFKYIEVISNDIEYFSTIKDFCGDNVKISYENATGIGYYWLIQLYDSLKEKWVTVPDNQYIFEIGEDEFTLIDRCDFNEKFNVMGITNYE